MTPNDFENNKSFSLKEEAKWRATLESIHGEFLHIGLKGSERVKSSLYEESMRSKKMTDGLRISNDNLDRYRFTPSNKDDERDWKEKEYAETLSSFIQKEQNKLDLMTSVSSPEEAYYLLLKEPSLIRETNFCEYGKSFIFNKFQEFYTENDFKHLIVDIKNSVRNEMPFFRLYVNKPFVIKQAMNEICYVGYKSSKQHAEMNVDNVDIVVEDNISKIKEEVEALESTHHTYLLVLEFNEKKQKSKFITKKRKAKYEKDSKYMLDRYMGKMKYQYLSMLSLVETIKMFDNDSADAQKAEVFAELELLVQFLNEVLKYDINVSYK